ncbi:hypothetical protein Lal_00027985 [Lupinus albus]|uniref:Uncharacterized protein n=1 Tax=Lupinus albus TaxID=3870 RepID=A0A6A5LJ82_LUPAL|nr:hypothetical protein Lalb_Chr21g0319501 [Lupinus albus]KAF1859803.1 hypothetical protein Lal_00027985 [Lupinus albus]
MKWVHVIYQIKLSLWLQYHTYKEINLILSSEPKNTKPKRRGHSDLILESLFNSCIMKKKKIEMMMMMMEEENNNTPRVSRCKDGPTIPTKTIVSAATATATQRSNNKRRFAAATSVDDGGGIDCSGKYLKSCMAGLIADCVALCCCPCVVVHCFALAFVKAPWVVGRRCLGLGKKNKDRKVKRKCSKRGYDYDYDYEDDDNDDDDTILERNRNRQMNLRMDTNNVVGEMDNVTVNAEKVWLDLYQIGHLDFGRISSSHD